jgi:hypothetical protein
MLSPLTRFLWRCCHWVTQLYGLKLLYCFYVECTLLWLCVHCCDCVYIVVTGCTLLWLPHPLGGHRGRRVAKCVYTEECKWLSEWNDFLYRLNVGAIQAIDRFLLIQQQTDWQSLKLKFLQAECWLSFRMKTNRPRDVFCSSCINKLDFHRSFCIIEDYRDSCWSKEISWMLLLISHKQPPSRHTYCWFIAIIQFIKKNPARCNNVSNFYWHVYVLGPAYFVWPWKSRSPHVTSRTECNIDVTLGTLTATDTCIEYHVTRFEAPRNVILHTRYVSTCVGPVCGRGRGTKINITDTHNNNKCDMYKSSLRHIHDPVLSSLKMKGIRLLYSIFIWSSACFGRHTAHNQVPKTVLVVSGFHTWKVVGRVEQLSDKINSVTCAFSWDLCISKVIFFVKENQRWLHSRTCNLLF